MVGCSLRGVLLGLGLHIGLLLPARAQYSTGYKWGLTELDSLVSVRTPVRGEPLYSDSPMPWLQQFKAASYYNRFLLFRIDLGALPSASGQLPADRSALHLNADLFFRALLKEEFLNFRKARLSAEYWVTVPSAPEGQAIYRSYTGRDEISDNPSVLEATWFDRNGVVYLFLCTTIYPDDVKANEEKQQFFSTIAVKQK